MSNLRTFSIKYLLGATKLLIKYPTATLKITNGREAVGHEIYLIRQKKYLKKPIEKKIVNGHYIYLNPKDTAVISPAIAEDGLYEPEVTALLKKILKKDAIVVDVGANIGWYTLLAAKTVGVNGKVIAFEPAPENYRLLKKSIKINNFNNVIAYRLCVSNISGTNKLYLGTQNLGGHSLKTKSGNNSIDVKTTTLDTTLKELHVENVDLLKIDVEGAEPEVIEGCLHYLSNRKIKNIFLEWNAHFWENRRDLLEIIIRNYEIYEFFKSPFLIRKITDITNLQNTALFLTLNKY